MSLSFTMKRHDTLPLRTISLIQTNPAGTPATIPVDLTNAASAKLIAKQSPGAGSFVSVLAFGSPKTGGTVIYTPVAGDTAISGAYQAEVEITWTTPAGVETFPNDTYFTITIVDDLG